MTNIPLNEQNARQLILYTVLPQLEELRNAMATLDESISRNFTDWGNELQQFQTTISQLTAENADLRAQLQPLSDQIAAAQSRLDEKSTELEANDPGPADNPPS